MLSIKDYLELIKIRAFLEHERDKHIRENNGYTSQLAEELGEMMMSLDRMILKLESED